MYWYFMAFSEIQLKLANSMKCSQLIILDYIIGKLQ